MEKLSLTGTIRIRPSAGIGSPADGILTSEPFSGSPARASASPTLTPALTVLISFPLTETVRSRSGRTSTVIPETNSESPSGMTSMLLLTLTPAEISASNTVRPEPWAVMPSGASSVISVNTSARCSLSSSSATPPRLKSGRNSVPFQ